MTQAAKAQEPSMEEILASIRRIIADDDDINKNATTKNSAAPERAAKAPPVVATPMPVPPAATVTPVPKMDSGLGDEPMADESEILDLTEPMPAVVDSAGFRTIEPGQDLVFDEARGEPELAQDAPVLDDDVAIEASSAEVPRAATATAAAARRQFEHDTDAERSLLSTTTTAAVDSAFSALAQTVLVQNSRTLDDLVREMLRPMLKSWLDDNLPNLVERLVRAEIDRVSRGRG
jgi:cell pole-organizing protein PopZ